MRPLPKSTKLNQSAVFTLNDIYMWISCEFQQGKLAIILIGIYIYVNERQIKVNIVGSKGG